MKLTDKDIARFKAKVGTSDHNGCQPWIASKFTTGYGQFQVGGKPRKAHRVAFLIAFNHLPDGLCVCHHCDNPSCCNPTHLFLGTQSDNTADKVLKGRQASLPGERNGQAKLTTEQVAMIRSDRATHKMLYRQLAEKYKITMVHAWRIVAGQRWSK